MKYVALRSNQYQEQVGSVERAHVVLRCVALLRYYDG